MKFFRIRYAHTWALSSFVLVLMVAMFVYSGGETHPPFSHVAIALGVLPALAALVGALAGWRLDRALRSTPKQQE